MRNTKIGHLLCTCSVYFFHDKIITEINPLLIPNSLATPFLFIYLFNIEPRAAQKFGLLVAFSLTVYIDS